MSIKYKGQTISGSLGAANEVYSTDETRIGTWIDGKPLYRKCFLLRSPSNKNSATPILEIQDITPIHIYGTLIVEDSVGSIIPLSFFQSTSRYLSIWCTTNAVVMQQSHDSNTLSNKPVSLVLEYIKTTDEATQSIAFTQSAQSHQIDTSGMTLTPETTSAATEIWKEKG